MRPPQPSESMHQQRRGRYNSPPWVYNRDAPPRQSQAQRRGWGREHVPPVLGLGIEAVQGMTNVMNAIANQVIRNSGRPTRNERWPYYNQTFRDYPALKRKFLSFQAN
jgi:hypothetical protein